MIPAKVRAMVYERDGWACCYCGRPVVGSVVRSIHHRRPRGMGGTKDPRSSSPANLVTVCGHGTAGCHGLIERHRATAYVDGFLLRSLDDRLTTPVVTPFGAFLLDDEGGRTAA